MGFKTSSARRSSAQSAVASSIVVLPDTTGTGPTLSGSGISANTTINKQIITVGQTTTQGTTVLSGLTVSNVYVTDSSFNNLDDTALDPAGGYLKIIGNGFKTGCAVYLNGSSVTTTLISSTELRVTTPASAVGTYNLMVFNPDGNGAIYLNLGVSNFPAYTTSAGSLGTVYETNPYTQSVVATGDAPLVYSLFSGSLPPNATLSSNGVISGTSPVENASNTYSFVVNVKDAQGQDSTRSFSLTISTDTVTWSSPANNAVITLEGGTAMSNVSLAASSAAGKTITYTANTLPTGVSLSGNTISGIPTTEQTVYTELTATANTTNRTAKRYVSWVVSLGDAYFSFTSLLLSAKTTVQVPSFINDNSTNKLELIPVGDVRPSNFDPYMGGYYSNYFDGTGDYLTVPDNTALQMGSGDFTIEFWIYYNSIASYQTPFSKGYTSAGDILLQTGNGNGALIVYLSGSAAITESTGASPGQWYHYALVRSGTTVTLYRNGVSRGTATSSVNFNTTNQLGIGAAGKAPGGGSIGDYAVNAYMSNLRVVKGTAVYTTKFTPSTVPLTAVANTVLLTCQDNRIIDDSINNFTVTRNGDVAINSAHPFATPTTVTYNTAYSTYFDGSSYAYLNNQVALGSGNFTIEFWANFRDVSSAQNLYEGRPNGASGAYPTIYILSGTIRYYVSSADRITSGTILTNNWYHIAVVRNSGTTTMYINGVSAGTYSDSTTYLTGASRPLIASYNGSGGNFTGYISNLRVVTGTAVYTSNFTPSTTPLTVIANTTLLTCQSTSLIDNSTNNFAITTVGTQPIAVSPFTVTANTSVINLGSTYFDGTSDVVTLPAGQFPILGTNNFTMEAWVYSTTTVGTGGIFDMWNGGTTAFLVRRSGTTWQFYVQGGSSVSSATLVANTWYHVAAVRNGTNVSLYINGVSVGTPLTTYSTSISSGGVALGIGGTATTGNECWTGYITDARIVVGTALYTANFLPPQAPLTAIANTQILTLQTNGGATNNGFVDQSSFNNIITRSGNATQGTFSPYGAKWSNHFEGSSSYLTFPSSTQYAFGTGAYTFEGWVFLPTGTNNKQITVQGSQFLLGTGGYAGSTVGCLRYYAGPTATTFVTTSSYLIANDKWNHFAVVRENTSSNGFKMYINGMLVFVGTDTANYGTSGVVNVGSGGGNDYLPGYISNFRIVKGSAVYTTASTTVGTQIFTPPTTPLTAIANTSLLTCQSNRFIDNSPNGFSPTLYGTPKIQSFAPFSQVTTTTTSYSNYFDGSGDFLSIPTTGNQLDATGDFTTEMWIYWNSMPTTGYQNICGQGAAGQNSYGLYAANAAGNTWSAPYKFKLNIANDGDYLTGNTTLVAGQWYHLAHTRTSGVNRLFVNGVLQTNTYTDSTSRGFAGNPYTIGNNSNCYISNFRYIKGTSLYTTTFTPSTAPLTAVANTQLLTCQSSTIIDNSNNYMVITGTGDTKPLPFNPFGEANTRPTSYSSSVFGGSVYLDGTGDYLLSPHQPTQLLRDLDFTIEAWVYTTKTGSEQVIVGKQWQGSQAAYASYVIYLETGNTVRVLGSKSGGAWELDMSSSTYVIRQNTWTHVALTRSGTTFRLFFNGILDKTTTLSGALQTYTDPLTVGAAGPQTSYNAPFQGWISDLRIITGKALYTNNFYPGNTPLTAIEYSNNSTSIANTSYASFLLSGTSGGVIDATRGSVIETSGTVKVTSNTSPFTTSTQSYYFNGSSGRLIIPASPNLSFGTGDFTVEFWMRTTDTSAGLITSATTGSGYWAILLSGGTLYWQNAYNASNLKTQSMTGYLNNAWVHVAIVRSSGSLNFYLNGTVQGTSTSDTTNYNGTANGLVIGQDASTNGYYLGYLTDLRITKGYARYTTNFTVPSGPLSEK